MTTDELALLITTTTERLRELSRTKGQEYTRGADDRLANFKRQGEAMGVEPMLILAVFLQKHLDSIGNYVKHVQARGCEPALSEPIDGRIDDAILYLLLLKGMCAEQFGQFKPSPRVRPCDREHGGSECGDRTCWLRPHRDTAD